MILQESKIYSSAEIAEWFGIPLKYFTGHRKNKLNILSNFCDWSQPKRGQYFIEKVYIAEFNKDLLKTKFKVAKALENYKLTLDTCINIGTKINRDFFNNQYTNEYIAKLVGQIMKENPEQYKYNPAVGIKKGKNGYATFRLFSIEEEQLYWQVIKEYAQEKANEKLELMYQIIHEHETGKISDKQFYQADCNLVSSFDFTTFRNKIKAKLNLTEEEYANRLRDFDPEEDLAGQNFTF